MRSNSREALFEKITKAKKRCVLTDEFLTPEQWLAQTRYHSPSSNIDNKILCDELTRDLETQSATVIRVQTLNEAANALSSYLIKAENSSNDITLYCGENKEINKLRFQEPIKLKSWQDDVRHEGDEINAISTAKAAASETGTLFLTSGNDNPTPLNFLSARHFVLLKQEDIVQSYEQAYKLCINKKSQPYPRTINMISGPSRTADIEQTLTLGAHGPIELIVVIYNEVG